MTAPAPTDRDAARDRVIVAAIVHVNDPQCSEAQMELEDAVADLLRLAGEARRLKMEQSRMTEKRVATFTATIFVAGDLAQATQVCREFCMTGLCVTVEPVAYVYTGGEEAGVRIGLLNYPRFPADPVEIIAKARALADLLRERLCQHSWLIVTPVETIWNSDREAA